MSHKAQSVHHLHLLLQDLQINTGEFTTRKKPRDTLAAVVVARKSGREAQEKQRKTKNTERAKAERKRRSKRKG